MKKHLNVSQDTFQIFLDHFRSIHQYLIDIV